MSTYWGFYCRDCDVETTHWLNHGRPQLREYIKARKAISTAGIELFHTELVISGAAWFDGEIEEFYDAHKEHDFVLKNEYGDTEEL